MEVHLEALPEGREGGYVLRGLSASGQVMVEQALREGETLTLSGSVVQWLDLTASVEAEEVPATFELAANYPNPFNPETVMEYGLPGSLALPLAETPPPRASFRRILRELASPSRPSSRSAGVSLAWVAAGGVGWQVNLGGGHP